MKSQYTGATANDPATRSYYQHPSTVTTNHKLASVDEVTFTLSPPNEFGGVLNRHTECTDCHNPHSLTATAPVQTASGWTAGGRLTGTSGTGVANGATANSTPTYSFLTGVSPSTMTAEYQLCMKCHSGFTNLPSNTGFGGSQQYLDKGIEFNPANTTMHPVEAQGKNQTTKMTANLSGTSPYKLWTFTTTSTIRCNNCHATNTINNTQGAGQDSPNHVSTNRSILILPYKDRQLKASNESYSNADAALCFACHTNVPFTSEANQTTATNFRYHWKHMAAITGSGTTLNNRSIDTPGNGNGPAICAECHFRLHSSSFPYNGNATQSLTGGRLVNFAPNVQPSGGVIRFSTPGNGTGTCTLVCHGRTHTNWSY